MGHPATKTIRLQRTLLADLIYLLCLVSLGFVDRGAIAQEGVGQDPRRMATDPTVLTVEQERHRRQGQARTSRNVRTVARR